MTDMYSPSRETTEGRVYNLAGGDWDAAFGDGDPIKEERIVLNMGPQHPSTHGVLRLVLELEGETVTDCRVVIGYLHTGIEKNTEYRTWTQGVTFLTRADLQRDGLLPGRRAAAGRRGAGPRAADPGAAHGDQPDLVALGVAGHRRHGAGGAHRDDQRVPGPRTLPGRTGDDHRPAHESRVRPPRWHRSGLARRRGREDPRVDQGDEQGAPRRRDVAARAADLGEPAQGRRLDRRRGLPVPRGHRADPSRGGAALGSAQDRAVSGLRDVRLRGPHRRPGRLLVAVRGAGGRDA